jgi:aryl-alcohol dehydrogenase-like predicted oxidoreductase
MEFQQFGRTGLKVSAIGFGCWEIGAPTGGSTAARRAPATKPARPISQGSVDTFCVT